MSAMRGVLVLLGAVALPVLFGGGAADDSEVEVPNVVGEYDVDAWYAIGEAGLEWVSADPDWGSTIVVEGIDWVVSAQDPPAGAVAQRGDLVTLTYRRVGSSADAAQETGATVSTIALEVAPTPTPAPVPAPVPAPAPVPVPAPAPAQGGSCDPSYPTVCIPSSPPDLDCGDVSYRRFVVLAPDPHGFDGDHDGVGCES
jgi:cell division septation protein DedD